MKPFNIFKFTKYLTYDELKVHKFYSLNDQEWRYAYILGEVDGYLFVRMIPHENGRLSIDLKLDKDKPVWFFVSQVHPSIVKRKFSKPHLHSNRLTMFYQFADWSVFPVYDTHKQPLLMEDWPGVADIIQFYNQVIPGFYNCVLTQYMSSNTDILLNKYVPPYDISRSLHSLKIYDYIQYPYEKSIEKGVIVKGYQIWFQKREDRNLFQLLYTGESA